jgi:putative transposase
MSVLRRYYSDDNIYFVTLVTHNRKSLLMRHHSLYWESLMRFMDEMNFGVIAHVELPDHIHMMIDPCECNLSTIVQKLKLSFYRKYRYAMQKDVGRVWQARFWDHMIRDQVDMNRHIDYIHYNPVKHGFVTSPNDWQYSSFHEYLAEGYYASDWGTVDVPVMDDTYGE